MEKHGFVDIMFLGIWNTISRKHDLNVCMYVWLYVCTEKYLRL